jgi:Tol biopolymer transport system component
MDDNQDAATPSSALDGSRPDTSTPDSDAGAKDSGTVKDSGSITDASADTGPKDSGNDGAVVDAGPTTPLFFLGDFATNNTVQLGRAHVPSSSSSTLAITSAAAATAKQVVAFDALADGTKVVLAADLTVTGRFDLVVANADGTGAITIATMPATGGVVDIAISPDGTKVAYLADAETDGAFDAYVVPLAGGAAPVRVSPARAAAVDTLDAQSIAWSRDSVYLAVAGDFKVDKKNELYVVDTTAAIPAPVAALAESALPAPAGTSTVGVSTGLRPIWTTGGKVCVKGDLTGAAPATFRLYCALANGTGFATPANFPALPAQLGSYGVSPDGATIAFSADTAMAGAYEIYTMKSDDSAAPVRVTAGNVTAVLPAFQGPSFNEPLVYSPDGTKIAFIADILLDGKNELYVVPAGGGAPEKRVTLVGAASDVDRDVQTFVWSPDSLALAFVADHRANNDFEVFRIPNVTTADQAPVFVHGVVVSGDVTALAWRP